MYPPALMVGYGISLSTYFNLLIKECWIAPEKYYNCMLFVCKSL